jgi:drug/metabolite transporter (DMT)-like permease
VPSLSFTTVASSVALVATQPVWAALIARVRGEPVPPGTWPGILLALTGVALLTAADLSISGRALFGDLLALAGGILAAAYVTVGSVVRRSVTTAGYATSCYAVAAGTLLLVCVVSRQDLWGYEARTWFALAGLVLGAQLLGHTVVNRVLRTLSPTVVSVGILGEIVGSTLLAWLWFDEVPSAALWPAAALIAAGVVVVVRGMRVPPAPPPAV